MKNTKRLLALLSLSALLLVTSCDKRIDNSGNIETPTPSSPSTPSTPQQQEEVRVDNGTEAAKILLAQERLDSSVVKGSNGLFTKGKKAFSRIINETRKYSRNYAKRENETYTEIEGDVVKWYNDVDYSNFNSFFKSYADNIESTAESGSRLIDNTKKYIRVVDKWVNVHGMEYLLKVDENQETIFSRSANYAEICRRSTDELGHDVYEMLFLSEETTTRMKYIPGLLYEFAISSGEYTHYLFAENYKGYWTVNSTSGSTLDYLNDEYIDFSTMILKDEACYEFVTMTNANGISQPMNLTIISNDHKTDLLVIGNNYFELFNTGIKGLDYLKIEASEDERDEFYNDYEKDKNTIVYEQTSTNSKGEEYTIYSTSGHKSATAVLDSGLEFTQGDKFLDGKLEVGRIDVSYVAGCDSYGRIPFATTATTLQENFELIKQFLQETGITFRRDLDEVINATTFAVSDVENHTKYYKWNGYSINDLQQVKLALQVEKDKTETLINEYNSLKNVEVIDISDQEAMNKNIYFADITLEKDMVVSNEGFEINLTEAEVKVTDTLLFVDKEQYSLVLALQNKEGTIFPIEVDENETITSTAFTKGQEFKTTQSLSVEIPVLDEGEYILVAYVATTLEGIRVTNPIAVKGTFTKASNIATGITQTISTNEDGNLLVTSTKTNDIYLEFSGTLTYDDMVNFLSENAYQYGSIGEVVLEKLVDGNWVVVEKPVTEEEVEDPSTKEDSQDQTSEQTQTENEEQIEKEEQIQEELESGQYRMKYIVTIADEASEETSENTSEEELQEVENGYVYVTYTRYIAVEDTVTEETTEQPKQ